MQERTEKPTQRKLKKARHKGDIAKSSELASALIFFCALLLIWSFSDFFERRLKETFVTAYSSYDLVEACRALIPLIYPILLVVGGIFLVAFFAHLFQTGWIWNWPLSKQGSERRLFFPFLKLVVIALIAYFSLFKEKPNIHLFFQSSPKTVMFIFRTVYFHLLKISLALLLLGICDFFYQKWKYYKRMHMTPQEVKEEKQESEGGKKN